MIDLSAIGNLEEVISTFKFRNSASIEIKKEKREIAFSMAVDIFIESVDFNLYESGKSNPNTQFYGYATLVFQDALSLEIPIHFPRQRIYYAIQWEALNQWRGKIDHLIQWEYHSSHFLNLSKLLAQIEEDEAPLTYNSRETNWIELPLREIKVRTQENCQFIIEYTQFQPISYIDPVANLPVSGKSNQIDGDKDSGLPDDIEAKRNPPDDPFLDNDPVSSESDLNQGGFGTSSNDPIVDPPLIRVAKIVGTYQLTPPECKRFQGTYYYPIENNENEFSEEVAGEDLTECGTLHQRTNVLINGRVLDIFIHDSPLSKSIVEVVSIPPVEVIEI